MREISFRILLIIFPILLISFSAFGLTKSPEIKESKITKSLKDVSVIITQYKSQEESPNTPICSANIEIFKNGVKIDSLNFSEIEAVGGHYGLLVYDEIIKNHIIISKFGDYNGLSIIINEKGQMFQTIGGCISLDLASGLLFSIYNSDLSGFSVFDLNCDKEIFRLTDIDNRPFEFYRYSNSSFLYTAINDENSSKTIWEIEFEADTIVQLDIKSTDIYGKELLKLSDCTEISIECE